MSADYTAWRITYQSSEQAAQAAYRAAQEHLTRCVELEAELEKLAAYATRLEGVFDALDTDWTDMETVISEGPEISLDCLIAEKQIEVLEELLNRIPGGVDGGGCDFECGAEVGKLLDKIRQQAEVES